MFVSNTSATQYEIPKSLRLRATASAYLGRTPSTNGNRKTWTLSLWVKRGNISGPNNPLFGSTGSTGSDYSGLRFISTDVLQWYDSGGTAGVISTNAVFRDPSAWYHIVFICDTTLASATDRQQIWVNGIRQATTGTQLTQNFDTAFNRNVLHAIGAQTIQGSQTAFFDGYLSEVNFIDGQALTPTSFGQYDASTGQWVAKKYSGAYGTNGFYLNFYDGSSLTNLGLDRSGNGNNWTTNNISITAGVNYDWMNDTPTNNYCTLNPLVNSSTTDGNLSTGTAVAATRFGSIVVPTGKWYVEFTIAGTMALGTDAVVGIDGGAQYINGGNISINGGAWTAYGSGFAAGDVVGMAADIDSGTAEFFRNGVSQGQRTGIPYTKGSAFLAYHFSNSGQRISVNFGQRPFAYTPPAGFKSLCTKNLPAPTIANPKQHFDVVTYTGNVTARNITGVGFAPGLIWIKERNVGWSHGLYDVVRGAGKALYSDLTNAEDALTGTVTAFNQDGFSLGTNVAENNTGTNYVSWLWKAGGDAVSNTAGSITSQVSANPTAGFSIVSYTGNGTGNPSIGHGLRQTPNMIIVKSRSDTTSNWWVNHSALSSVQHYLILNTTAAVSNLNSPLNNFGMNSTTFSVLNNSGNNTNTLNANYIAYCFAEVTGYSKFGSYTGNGSTDGPFVYCGFRPRYVLVKRTDTASDWQVIDTGRSQVNAADARLWANLALAETANGAAAIDFVSNGFKFRSTVSNDSNANGGTYIFAAFAEAPFKYATAR